MKKLIIIPLFCLFALLVQGSGQGDFTEIVDSLKSTSDTFDTWNIDSLYHKPFQYQYLIWKDTGATYADSVKIYGIDANGNEFLCQLENLSAASSTISNVTNGANATTIYEIKPRFLSKIKVVRNGNAIYTANVRGDYTIRLVSE